MLKGTCLFAALALVGGAFAQYQSDSVRFLGQIPLNEFPGAPASGAGCYGYTSPSGREYVTMGLRNGTAVVEITNPVNPTVVGHIPGPNSLWHENVVMNRYCYSVSDGGGAVGIQIIDLNPVDNGVVNLVATYDGAAVGKPLSNVHTLQADPGQKRLYANGSNRGFVVFDARNPRALVEMGNWTKKYVHDSLVLKHLSGPWKNKQIAYLFCGTAGLSIVDVTNPANMIDLGELAYYPNGGGRTYCHSASLTPDLKHLYINDEFDENQNLTPSATTVILDVQNLMNPVKVGEYQSGIDTVDHNSLLRDGFLYLSAYKAGIRIYDTKNPTSITEAGWLDTFPTATDDTSYEGNWGVYSLFPSKVVALSDINRGLILVDPAEAIGLGAPITSIDAGNMGTDMDPKFLRESDDFRIRNLAPVQPQTVTFRTRHKTNRLTSSSISVTLECRGRGTAFIRLRNWQTGLFESVRSFPCGIAKDATSTVSGLSKAKYMNASGEVEVQIQAKSNEDPAPRWEFDLVRVDVAR